MKRILIMGGNQFVGKEVAKNFCKKENTVYVLNRGTHENIKEAIHLECDRNNFDELKRILKDVFVDVIIDISAYTDVQANLIQAVMKNKFKHYILISSASVYNNIGQYPAVEEDSIDENPIWGDYAKNKYLAEKITIENSKNFDFKYIIFRPFYIYGIGNNLDRENYIFSRIKYGLPIFLPNKGEEIVQFGYIDDLVSAIEMSTENPMFYDNILNISGDEAITFNKLIEIAETVMDKKIIKRYIDTNININDIKARDWFPFRDVNLFGDISKIKGLGFENKYSIFEGLKKVYTHNEENGLIVRPKLSEIEKTYGIKNQ